MHILINKNYLKYNKQSKKQQVKIGYKKQEGDLITPRGQFKIKYLLYRKDRLKILTKLKKELLKKIWVGDDPKSSQYNKLVRLPSISMKNFQKGKYLHIV